jgi:hypothetical protein
MFKPDSGRESGRMPMDLELQALHLVFQAQLQFLEPHFFQFFVFGEETLLGEGFQPLGVLRMLLNQSLELIMTGQELLSWSQHPCQTSCCLLQLGYKVAQISGGVQ